MSAPGRVREGDDVLVRLGWVRLGFCLYYKNGLLLGFDYFTDLPIFSTITRTLPFSIICGIGFSRICLSPYEVMLTDKRSVKL